MTIRPNFRVALATASPLAPSPEPIVLLWMLRMMVPAGAHREFIGAHGFSDDTVAERLGLGKWTEGHPGTFKPHVVRAKLRQLHANAERDFHEATAPDCLASNVQRLAELVGLSPTDCRILEFAVMGRTERLLAAGAECLGSFSTWKLIQILSILLGLPEADIRASLDAQSVLTRSGLLSVNRTAHDFGETSLIAKLVLLSDSFADHIATAAADPMSLLRDMVTLSAPPHLEIADYAHMGKALSIMRPYLAHAVTCGRKGVNVFLHGDPGTGKTQLARVLAKALDCELFEVASADQEGDPVAGERRLQAYRAAQCFLGQRRAIILFDEMEDAFHDGDAHFGRSSTAQRRKAWINRMLEDNAIPTLWLSNSAGDLDPAFVRRFDMVFELPVPPKKQRERIIREACANLLDAPSVARMAESASLTPAVVARATSVVRTIHDTLGDAGASEAIELLIGNTLQTQGHPPLRRHDPNHLAEVYDPAFIHADADLIEIAAGLVRSRSGRLCLYGPPGTGKTAFGRWLAEQMEAPLQVERASDLMSMWVGGNEKNIARAFKQAEQQGALLLIDEVDSFLQDRRGAHSGWQVSQVNEMLTQMESFPGVFIASTNLMNGLDQAALRRFDLKVKFDFLQPAQARSLFRKHCTRLALPAPTPAQEARLGHLSQLTPGDFAAVARQSRFRPVVDINALLAALEAECAVKNGAKAVMGFLH